MDACLNGRFNWACLESRRNWPNAFTREGSCQRTRTTCNTYTLGGMRNHPGTFWKQTRDASEGEMRWTCGWGAKPYRWMCEQAPFTKPPFDDLTHPIITNIETTICLVKQHIILRLDTTIKQARIVLLSNHVHTDAKRRDATRHMALHGMAWHLTTSH